MFSAMEGGTKHGKWMEDPSAATAQVAQPLSKQLIDRRESIGTIPDEFLCTRQKAVQVRLV